jgi:broad specificity phosphatase PhoE
LTQDLPEICLARHGETAWSLSGQHTGLTDIPLTAHGEEIVRRLGKRLAGMKFAHVFTSPLQRARRTCELAGFAAAAVVDPDLVEWNYGAYEGLRREEILRQHPDWDLFRDGSPGGEGLAEITARADRVINRLRALTGASLVFSSGHFLRVVGARWCGCEAAAGRHLFLGTASVSLLGYEHALQDPVLKLWNDTHHVNEPV